MGRIRAFCWPIWLLLPEDFPPERRYTPKYFATVATTKRCSLLHTFVKNFWGGSNDTVLWLMRLKSAILIIFQLWDKMSGEPLSSLEIPQTFARKTD